MHEFIPVNGTGQIYPTVTALSPTPTLHLTRFKESSFSKPTLLLSFSTCIFLIFFDCPRFLLPFISKSNTSQNMPSSLLNTCPCITILLHLPLPFESLFPSIPTSPLGPLSSFSRPSVFCQTFLSALVLLKIAVSFSLKHHVTLQCYKCYNML